MSHPVICGFSFDTQTDIIKAIDEGYHYAVFYEKEVAALAQHETKVWKAADPQNRSMVLVASLGLILFNRSDLAAHFLSVSQPFSSPDMRVVRAFTHVEGPGSPHHKGYYLTDVARVLRPAPRGCA